MTSDLFIPRLSDIAARALDCRESAARLADTATVRQLDRLIAKLPGARLCWQLGTLHVSSPSGSTYHVTRAGCDCPNGTKSHARQCWHVAAFELLLDMLDTEAESADLVCDPPGDNPLDDGDEGDELPLPAVIAPFLSCGLPNPLYRIQVAELTRRIAAARSCYLYR